MGRRSLAPALVGLAGAVLLPVSQATAESPDAAVPTQDQQTTQDWSTDFHAWSETKDFAAGDSDGVIPADKGDGAVRLAPDASEGTWTSPWYDTPEAFTHAVPSWQADTPGGSSVDIEFQVRTGDGTSSWYRMATWAFEADAVERTTHDGQSDDVGAINTDEFIAADGVQATGFRMRAVLHGGDGDDKPTIRQLASTTALPGEIPDTSEPIENKAVELDVPSLSQMTHRGEYPDFGGGGQVWCSPTSTTMVMSYYGVGPTQQDIDSLPPDPVFDENDRVDGEVDWGAIHTWDYAYDGAGNWAFNTAYASSYGLDASVQRQTNLRDVEELVRSDVPVVITIRWDNTNDDPKDDLEGAPIDSSNGHLMVVVGFTESGDPIVNDPAAPDNEQVRRVYQRDQFEYNWLRSAEGLTYVITDPPR